MPNSAGVIDYREGTVRRDFVVGAAKVHTFVDSSGASQIKVPEHSVFLVESDVVARASWEGTRYPVAQFRAGDVQFLPAGSEARNLYLSGPYSETMLRIPVPIFTDAVRGIADREVSDLKFAGLKDQHVFGISRMLRKIVLSKDASPVLADAVMTALSIALMCGMSPEARINASKMAEGLSGYRKGKALEFIHENLSKPMLMGQIADAAALSPCHFSRSFKIAMGVSPARYVLGKRVEMASRMLVMTKIPLAAVALACGFSSQSHFATSFKEATGLTASVYRSSAA